MTPFFNIIRDRSFRLTILMTLTYFGIGFLFLHYGLADYGWIFFVLLPTSLGIAIGAMPVKKWAYIGGLVGIIIFILLLIVGGLEGMVCVLMSIPIIIPLVWVGILINRYLMRKGVIKPTNEVKILVLPLVITLLGSPTEKYLSDDKAEVIEVKTERIYPYTTEQVYDAIKSVDTLSAEKPFLMRLDLPVPHKCVLEKEEIGGLRTCHFTGGTITERITELEKGRVLRMDVIDYKLTGRKWLGFKEAIYYFEKVGQDSCKMTRITTYTSVLRPRVYWETLEKLGITQEHDYVFDNLANDLEKEYSGE